MKKKYVLADRGRGQEIELADIVCGFKEEKIRAVFGCSNLVEIVSPFLDYSW